MSRKLFFALLIVIGITALVIPATSSASGTQVAAQRPPDTRGGRPALVEAVRRGDVTAVRALIAKGANVNTRSSDGSTALHWAADAGDLTIVDILLRAGADANAANRYGVRPLPLACENGNPLVVERLLKAGADPNVPMSGGQTPLMTAARTGNAAAVKLLLAKGAKVNAAEDRRGETALMFAAAEGHASVVEELLAAGADINAKSQRPTSGEPKSGKQVSASAKGNASAPTGQAEEGTPYQRPDRRLDSFTPLLFAVQLGRLDAVHSLVEHGANVNDKTPDGTSALVITIANGHFDVASYLVDRGADPSADAQGWNALVQLVRTLTPQYNRGPQLGTELDRPAAMALAQKLLDHGVKVDARIKKQIPDGSKLNEVGATAYILATKGADATMMRFLLKNGADPNVKTVGNRTALMCAAGIDMHRSNEDSGLNVDAIEAVKIALEAGADVNAVDSDGETALHGAAYRGQKEIVQMLVDHGAKLDVRDNLGFTPLMWANGDIQIGDNLQRNPEIVAYLKKEMTDRGLPTPMRSDEEKFDSVISTGFKAVDAGDIKVVVTQTDVIRRADDPNKPKAATPPPSSPDPKP